MIYDILMLLYINNIIIVRTNPLNQGALIAVNNKILLD